MGGVGSEPFVLGLGANLGDSLPAVLQSAIQVLRERIDSQLRVSPFYRTAPIGPEQPDFVNAAVFVHWSEGPARLLEVTARVETEFGRVREVHWGPRTLDIDLLWSSRPFSSQVLTVPHPRLRERAFALRPLLDLLPDAADPVTGRFYRDDLTGLQHHRIEALVELNSQKNE